MKSTHGHVEEIEERPKKNHRVKQRRNLKYCRRKKGEKRAVTTVDGGSTRDRAALRFALEE